jgi:hypothetical protein
MQHSVLSVKGPDGFGWYQEMKYKRLIEDIIVIAICVAASIVTAVVMQGCEKQETKSGLHIEWVDDE